MIFQAAVHITSTLNSCPNILTEFGTDIYWELAEEDTGYPFLTFNVTSDGPATLDGIAGFQLNLRIFAKSLHEAARISEVIIADIKSNPVNWKNKGSRSGYTDTSAKEGFIELTYNFKY